MQNQENLQIQQILQSNFPQDKQLQTLTSNFVKDQPKLHKIKDFKSRILSLLELYAENTKTHQYFFKALKGVFQLISPEDVHKLDKIINITLKRGANNVGIEQLTEVIKQYQRLLLITKKNKDSKKFTQTFNKLFQVKLSISEQYQQSLKETLLDLLDKYINKRAVHIHPETFKIIITKFKFAKSVFHNKLTELQNDQQLRESMKKQIRKMIKWFQKSKPAVVKIE